MSRKRQGQDLADLIADDFLRHATGQLDIKIDDLVVAYRKANGGSLADATLYVQQRLPSARQILEEDVWLPVPVTDIHFDLLAQGRNAAASEVSDKDRYWCLAGLQRPMTGLHFALSEDDLLFIEARIQGLRIGTGVVRANVRRVETASGQNQLTAGAVGQIADRTGIKNFQPARQVKRLLKAGDPAPVSP